MAAKSHFDVALDKVKADIAKLVEIRDYLESTRTNDIADEPKKRGRKKKAPGLPADTGE